VATGVLVAESLQLDAELDVHWRVRLPDANARALAHALADIADKLLRTGWCVWMPRVSGRRWRGNRGEPQP
jgi:hypothetical protein